MLLPYTTMQCGRNLLTANDAEKCSERCSNSRLLVPHIVHYIINAMQGIVSEWTGEDFKPSHSLLGSRSNDRGLCAWELYIYTYMYALCGSVYRDPLRLRTHTSNLSSFCLIAGVSAMGFLLPISTSHSYIYTYTVYLSYPSIYV